MNPMRDALIIVLLIVGLAIVATSVRTAGDFRGEVSRTIGLPDRGAQTSSARTSEIRQPSERELEREREREARSIEREIEDAQKELAAVEAELELIEKYGEPSPYAGLVTMRKSAGPLRTEDVDREYILLEAEDDNSSRVVISGWKIQSAITGITVEIPEAVHLVFAGSPGSDLPVDLAPGDKAYITTGRSPIGTSFRVNKCSGYYEQFQTFVPSIKRICPDPEDEILAYERDRSIFINNECLDFVERISKCTVQTKPLPLSLSPQCQEAIIEEISYNSCIDKHKSDADFRVPEWRLYLRRDNDLWRDKREVIKILDQDGKTVDYYSY